MFKAFGVNKRTGHSFILTWEDGVLSGDEFAEFIVAEVKQRIKHDPTITVGVPGGPYWTGKKILKSDQGTFLLLYQMYGEVELISGKLSPLPSIPKAAIP